MALNISFAVPSPVDYFAALVKSDDEFPLLEAAICLAHDEYPELDVQQVLGQVDQLLERMRRRLPADAGPLQKLRALNHFFWSDLRFGGNVNHYDDPDNSYLNVLMHTRRGIPISLAVLWLELAQGLGLVASGVGFPGHFLVKVNLPNGQVVIDPMDGHSLTREELEERLEPYRRRSGLWDEEALPLSLYLQAATGRDIIERMLRNLRDIHHSHQDTARELAVLHRLLVLLPRSWSDYRDRGFAYATAGQLSAALADLQIYLENAAEAQDAALVAQRMRQMLGES